ncbi:MAG: hypothetical protein PHU21_03125 [Elusimicrobia bacterium]|nr:hypothetical protein [Elusimicrobiota bacterium]
MRDPLRTRVALAALAAALLGPPRAGAWEVKVQDVDRRIQEVQGRWKDAQGKPVLRSILRGARRGPRPGWARKVRRASDPVCWSESYAGKTYYFAVGLVERVKDPYLRLTTAQDRARAGLLELLGGHKTPGGAEGEVAGAVPIDWYGTKNGSLYALLVVVR